MQTTAKLYTDIDYESFPIADLDLDLHWIQLPNSVLAVRRQAKLLALQQERAKTLPKDHKVFLVPADPLYSPTEEDLWPVFTQTVHQCLANFPEARRAVSVAIGHLRDEHRGWRNPFPANFEIPSPPKTKK